MAAAELKLQVGLDLAFFRQQLAQLGNVAVGYQMPINIKFDRLGIQQELNRLATNINRRKYKLEVATNIKSETEAAQKLDAALDALKDKEINVKFAGTGDLSIKEARKIRAALRASILTNGGKIEIPTTIKAAITQDDIRDFKNAVKSKLTGLSVDVKANVQGKGFAGTEHGYAGVMQYMQKEGLIGKTASGMTGQMGKNGDNIKQQLGDAVKSAEKIKSIFDGVAKSIATTGKSTANVQGKRLSLGNVPLMAGGVERRIEKSSAAIGATLSADALKALYPEVSKTIASFVALKGQIQQNTSKLSGFSLILGLAAFAGVPLAKSVVKLTGSANNFAKLLDELGLKLDTAFTKAAFNILSATSGRMLSGGSVAGLLPAAYRGIGPSAGPAGLLPPAYRGIGASRNAGALPPAYRGLPAAYRGIGPSAGAVGLLPAAYRGIGASRNAGALGGTAFGSQKYLPTALGDETKKVLRDAAHAFLRVMREEIRKVVYQVNVQDLGQAINRQAMLPGGRTAGYLPPVARFGVGRDPNPYSTGRLGREGETQAELFARREREARIKSAFREMDVMGGGAGRTAASYNYAYRAARPTSAMVPYAAGGALVTGGGAPPAPPTPPGGGRGGFGSFGSFRGAMPNVSLPGAGLVKEVGDQFGYAAKQVLLFSTTYKALAFLTDFPTKVGEAVAQLQTFRNTLQAITPNADEFQKSNQFILDTVDKYNIPIQSARDGFTKLYASMEPAGFSGEQIQKLFLGISKASATLGLSSDKVDRVTYAFSQMASKGQLMSEEVTGQLGDVIPGALSIMAKAANMDIKTFKKAMEDGVFVGKAFTDVMSNVPIVLEQRFGKGAEGAAKTFQGQMNAMATATKMLYESFVPVGDLFTSKIVAPFTKGLKVLADGFNAFFSGAATKTAGGSALFQELEKLRPTFKGIEDNIKQLLPILQSFATTILGLGKILLQIAGNPFAGYLARVYLAVLPLTMAIQALNLQALVPMIASFVRAIPAFIAYQAALLQGVSANKSLQLSMVLTGQSAGITAGKIRLVGAALGSLAVGGIVLGIGVLIERFMSLGAAIDGVHQATKQTVQGISSLANTGDVGGLKNILADTKKQVETFRGLRQFVSGGLLGGPSKQLTQSAANQMKALGLERFVSNDVTGKPYVNDFINASKLIEEKLKGLEKAAGAVQEKLPLAGKIAENIRQQAKKASDAITPIAGAGGDEKSARAAATALAGQQALADKLSADQTKTDIERQKTLFENEKSMINMAYDLREARANSFQKETIRFQKELFNIEMERQKAVLDANSAVTKAQGAVAGGTGGATGLLQGSTGISSAAHFDVRRQDGGYISPQQARALFEASVAKQLQLTSTYGPRKAPVAGASTFHRGVDLAGPANTPLNLAQGYSMVGAGMKGGLGYTASVRGPQGEMYDVGHLQQPKAGVPSGKVTGRQKRVAVAEQQTENALQDKKVKITLAEAEALKKAEIAMVNYVSSIAPVAEQDLQNQLLGKRIELMQGGTPEAFAETQMKIFEAQEKVRIAGEQLDLTNQKQVEAYEKLKQSLPGYIALLEDAAVKQQQLSFTKAMKDLGDRAAMARAFTPQAELQTRLQQQGYTGAQLGALFETEQAIIKAEELKTQMQGVASTIGDAFSTAFQGIINGSVSAQEALGNMFKSIGESFVKMAMDMIAKQLVMITLGFIMKALGLAGSAAGGGLSDLNAPQSINNPLGIPAAANGAIFSSGIAKFATGGIVNGPTLFPFANGGAMQMGLMGEAGPEAIMPLQRGPDGALGVRAAMGGNSMGGSSSPILNMNFETSTINGVEYVSRDQLEAAMAQTRRQASSDGAKRGMAMTLDKIQQSPQTRRRIGM
jgi:lambda family phage tail tape measure protein